jgi:demethylmenaquinone methyltransferase/2-methoxy-6-polyprenyl-1,4-benzoquinol methylase
MADIYNTGYVEKLFDEMSGSYEKVNYVTSFGFSKRWRKWFVKNASINPGMTVCDLMCGMGECWSPILSSMNNQGELIAVDLSSGMLKGAKKRTAKFPAFEIKLDKQNALASTIKDVSVDCVVSAFGIKTFSDEQKTILAAEMWRILKPQGTFSLVEVSVPKGYFLKTLYMFYLKKVIPLIGLAFLGNAENYRMLGVYTEKFGNCKIMHSILEQQGFQVTYHDYFFGSATGISGIKKL